MQNIPQVKVGLVAASRDCFPRELSLERAGRVLAECKQLGLDVTLCGTLVQSDADVPLALRELEDKGLNALVIYLGNFGPEGPVSMLAQRFSGPVMLAAAAEETAENLVNGRGDAYCGLLSARYNLALRKVEAYLPEYPVGLPDEVAAMIELYIPVARVVLGVRRLKVISFGPRPHDFNTCHAPLEPLYGLGVEVMENSELDLYDLFEMSDVHPRLEEVEQDMKRELGGGEIDPKLLGRLARLELALTDFIQDNTGASSYVALANKCWPSFEKYFGCVPCYVNSRLSSRGIPSACEADIYGALSQYLAAAATAKPTTLLDINNTVPRDLAGGAPPAGYNFSDLFMGFHCGNTPSSCMKSCGIGYQLIMHRLMEPGGEPDITRGTLEGQIAPGEITLLRLQASPATTGLAAYVAEGELLDLDPRTFGGAGVIAVPQMARFYRNVLLGKAFPHHTAVAFGRAGQSVSAALKLLGVKDVSFNLPADTLYPGESPYW